jgi:DNA-binding NarL/FixJ family response regulator
MVATRKTTVVIVDDHPLFRAGLAVALRREADLELLGEAADSLEAIELAKQKEIDVAVIDVLMPSVSGISLASELRDIQPSCKILGLSVVDEPGLIADMLRAGASGFALKTQPVEEILEAIRTVLGGVRYLPPRVSRDAIEAELGAHSERPFERLTRREREVFELLIRGHSNTHVATQLFISRRTVETHRQRIMKKLSARSIVEMLRVAALHGGLAA